MEDLVRGWRPAERVTLPDRLELRSWRPTDASALSAAVIESLPELLPWMPWAEREPLELPERIELLEAWDGERRQARLFNYAVLKDDAIAGSAGLMSRIGPAALEIGYWTHTAFVGTGIATAVARALTDLAFSLPHVARVEIHHDKGNVASGRIPAKLGYELVEEYERRAEARDETGRFLRWVVRSGEWVVRSC